MGKKIGKKYSALTVLSYVFLFASIEFLPFYLTSPHTPMFEFTPLTWVSLGFLTICCPLIAFLVYNFSLDKLSASTVAMTIYITPLSGVFLGAVLLGESFTAYTLVGSILIIGGLLKQKARVFAHSGSQHHSILKVSFFRLIALGIYVFPSFCGGKWKLHFI